MLNGTKKLPPGDSKRRRTRRGGKKSSLLFAGVIRGTHQTRIRSNPFRPNKFNFPLLFKPSLSSSTFRRSEQLSLFAVLWERERYERILPSPGRRMPSSPPNTFFTAIFPYFFRPVAMFVFAIANIKTSLERATPYPHPFLSSLASFLQKGTTIRFLTLGHTPLEDASPTDVAILTRGGSRIFQLEWIRLSIRNWRSLFTVIADSLLSISRSRKSLDWYTRRTCFKFRNSFSRDQGSRKLYIW